MTLLLLDTNAYLRFAKRIKPLLGVQFGNKKFVLTVLPVVEDEFRRSIRLQERFPWFTDAVVANERLSRQVRLSSADRESHDAATSVLRQSVLENPLRFRNTPSRADCSILAFSMVRESIVVTDDLSMHTLAAEFEIKVMHGHEALRKMLAARKIDKAMVREIYEALNANGDLPATWVKDRDAFFPRIFNEE